jgi:hypothetical protein
MPRGAEKARPKRGSANSRLSGIGAGPVYREASVLSARWYIPCSAFGCQTIRQLEPNVNKTGCSSVPRECECFVAMTNSKSFLRGLWILASCSLLVVAADASPSAEAERLIRIRPRAERYTLKALGTSIEVGAARVHVKAPLELTKSTVIDYGRYGALIDTFEKARVVGKQGDQTDVYLRVPILEGAARIWALMRFDPPRKVSGDEYVVNAKMLKGNIKRFEATYRIKRIDAQNTQLNLEMLIVPSLPVPGSLVTTEVTKASDRAVCSLRNGTEKLQAK